MENTSSNKNEFDAAYFARNLSDTDDERHPLIRDEHEMILRVMPPRAGEKILDVGCGKGRLERFLSRYQPGIDMISSDVTEEAKRYIKGVFVRCSMTDMPFPDQSFDKLFCQQVLSHFRDGEQGVNEAFRVLKRGGKLMILTPNKYYVYAARAAAALGVIPPLKADPTARWLYSVRTMRRLFCSRPWTSVEFRYFQRAPRWLPFSWMRPKIVAVATK